MARLIYISNDMAAEYGRDVWISTVKIPSWKHVDFRLESPDSTKYRISRNYESTLGS